MGLFDSKKITHVGTSVSRVIEDDALPNAPRSAVVHTIFNGGSMTRSVISELVNSVGMRAERMYDYAKEHYPYGLPSGQMHSSSKGAKAVQEVLKMVAGQNVDLKYMRYGPPNHLHIGWMNLLQQQGYNSATNQLAVLTATKRVPVHLKDMVVVIPAALMAELDPGILEQWGTAPSAGQQPGGRAPSELLADLTLHTPVYVDPLATEEHVLVTYAWEESQASGPDGGGIFLPVLMTGTFTMSLAGYRDEADYFHARYSVNGEDRYWMYEAGTGVYPELDKVYEAPPEVMGTYFPFTYFRYAQKRSDLDKDSAEYKTSKRMMKFMGIAYDDVIDAIDENPDIKDVEQAMMIMAVPANSQNPIEQRYLFDYFDGLFHSQEVTYASASHMFIESEYVQALDITKSTQIIQDTHFRMSLSNGGIYKRLVAGILGPKGTHTVELSTVPAPREYLHTGPGGVVTTARTIVIHIYRRQVTDVLYEEIKVAGMKMAYHVFGDYTAIGDENDSNLLVPIDRTISEDYTISERELLYARSMHFVINSRQVTSVKWYAQDWFQAFIMVVAMVITVFTAGTSANLMAAAVAAGKMTLVMVVQAFLIGLLKAVAVGLAAKLFVQEVGGELAMVVAIIAAVYAMASGIGTDGGMLNTVWARDLLSAATSLMSAVDDFYQNGLKDIFDEMTSFGLLADEKTQELEAAQDLLKSDSILTPFIMFGEEPQDYFSRTIHSGNIGTLVLKDASTFVRRALTLPTLNDTIGGKYS